MSFGASLLAWCWRKRRRYRLPDGFKTLPQDIQDRLADHFQTSPEWRRARAVAKLRNVGLVVSVAITSYTAFFLGCYVAVRLAALDILLLRTLVLMALSYTACIAGYFSRDPSGSRWTYAAKTGALCAVLIIGCAVFEYLCKRFGVEVNVVAVLGYVAIFLFGPISSWNRADSLLNAEIARTSENAVALEDDVT